MNELLQTSLFAAPPDQITLFVDVIVPVPVPNLFTYRVPADWNDSVQTGCRVIVEFGKGRIVTGIIARIHQAPPKIYQAKYLLELLDEYPSVTEKQIKLFHWVAEYYLCAVGDVLNVALPSGMKITSKSNLQLNPAFRQEQAISDKEMVLYEIIKNKGSLAFEDAEKVTGQSNIHRIIKSLINKKAILVFEEIKEKYSPKILKKVRLTSYYLQTENLEMLFAELEKSRKEKQIDVLLKYLSRVPVINQPEQNENGLEKNIIAKLEGSESALKTLIKNGVFEEFEIIVSRFEDFIVTDHSRIQLSRAQTQAKNEIFHHFESKPAVLLHGVTGSGKTAIYIDLIREVLESGSQVLYLLPEIALTTQIVSRLRKTFGDRMGIYHSKFSDNERVEVWRNVLQGSCPFVIGVRSAIMLPFDSLGLIIVDEEHETTYKQHDPAPRYHARDLAVVVAGLHGAKVVLGSATPSVETYTNALAGKYGLVKLNERFGDAQMPHIQLINTTEERKRKTMKQAFTSVVLDELTLNLEKKEQSILFQNRRGYSPYLTCEECAYIPKCPNCDVSLTYHQYNAEIRCHYCSHAEPVPKSCPACGSTKIKAVGFGTEKIEDDLKLLLPTAHIERMDLDTTRSKHAYEEIINRFEQGETDILIGTQMISKGLDFDKVSLVGIFDADRSINFPDFRSHERTFQLLTQVSGRAGRRKTQGKVVIQTADPMQEILQRIVLNDYEGFYENEIAERKKFHYPPFTRIIKVVLKHKEQEKVMQASAQLADILRIEFGEEMILGPQAPLVERVRNLFLQDIILKIPVNTGKLREIKQFIRREMDKIATDKAFKSIRIYADVDPV
jgi:primosomal protein N' (replication factor Y) (superfamily II helicase)